jgi:pyruvate dehydrogenase E2 component (dihydrolipoamide acetyltransferase)
MDEPKGEAQYVDEPFTKIREVIAKTMTASMQRGAQLTHHHSFDATSILAIRERFKASDEASGYRNVSVGDIMLYVTSRILAKHPEINALIAKEGVRKYFTVNLGIAVDTDRGLMVPTIFGAEKKSLKEISAEVKSLAAAARDGRISPDYLAGGTFTVSNLGATGVEMFTPIINPPQAAILGICGVTQRIRKGANGGITVYPAIGLSLTYDHRAIDGAPASRFADELCKALTEFSWEAMVLDLK